MRKIFLLFLLCSLPILAQQKTAYQKKIEEIQNKYLQKYGVSLSRINQLRKDKELGNAAVEALLYEKIQNYGKTHGNVDVGLILIELSKEMNAAEKLKTPAELKKEKEEIEKRIAQQKKLDEQRKLANAMKEKELKEKLERESEIQREREIQREKREEEEKNKKMLQEEKMRQDFLNKFSDVNYLKEKIRDNFIKWAQKGEFETSNEFKERLQNRGKEVLKKESYKILTSMLYELEYNLDLGAYDADNQLYPIKLKRKTKAYKINQENDSIYNQFSNSEEISIIKNLDINNDKALYLKKLPYKDVRMSRKSENSYSEYFKYIQVSINLDDWIIQKGYFFPIKLFKYDLISVHIDVHGNFSIVEKLLFSYTLDRKDYLLISEIEFSTSDLGLSEYFHENYTFKLNSEDLKKMIKNNYQPL
jgi:hypothetical protein